MEVLSIAREATEQEKKGGRRSRRSVARTEMHFFNKPRNRFVNANYLYLPLPMPLGRCCIPIPDPTFEQFCNDQHIGAAVNLIAALPQQYRQPFSGPLTSHFDLATRFSALQSSFSVLLLLCAASETKRSRLMAIRSLTSRPARR